MGPPEESRSSSGTWVFGALSKSRRDLEGLEFAADRTRTAHAGCMRPHTALSLACSFQGIAEVADAAVKGIWSRIPRLRKVTVPSHHGRGRASGVGLGWSLAYACTVRAAKTRRTRAGSPASSSTPVAGQTYDGTRVRPQPFPCRPSRLGLNMACCTLLDHVRMTRLPEAVQGRETCWPPSLFGLIEWPSR
jgi:hypothetical protein